MNEREKLYYQIEIAIDQCENKSTSKEEIEETVKLQTKNIFSQLKTTDRLADNQEEICDAVHNIHDVLDSHLKWLDCLHDEDKYIFDRLLTLERAFIAFVIITTIILTSLVIGFYIF